MKRTLAFIVLVASMIVTPDAGAADPSRLVFLDNRQMFTVPSSGAEPRELPASDPMELSGAPWSPGGRQVVYFSIDATPRIGNPVFDAQLRVVRSDGRGDRKLVGFRLCCATWPVAPVGSWVWSAVWSPDGARIAFLAIAGACPLWYTCGSSTTLWVVRPDGTGLRMIAADVAGDEPSWSPDGRRIAFVRAGAVEVGEVDGVRPPRRVSPIHVTAGRASWSPDGRRIAFVGWPPAESLFGKGTVWVARADGSASRRLPAYTYEAPSWSPDSRWIAHSDGGIVIVRSDGRLRRRLTVARPREAEEWWPRWSPDGQVAFLRDTLTQGRGIFAVSPQRGRPRRIVSFGTDDVYRYAWEPARAV